LRVRIACDQVRKWPHYVVNSPKLFDRPNCPKRYRGVWIHQQRSQRFGVLGISKEPGRPRTHIRGLFAKQHGEGAIDVWLVDIADEADQPGRPEPQRIGQVALRIRSRAS
jgi:hypothetical protein